MYKWHSKGTGELCKNLREVIHAIYENLRYYHFVDLKWEYNRDGF